jgi:site-specific DNA-cytosine methylase
LNGIVTINSYAGSLVLGTKAATGDLPVASLEDVGYGVECQRANFPSLTIYPKLDDWPAELPRNKLVLAHPPCAAFSINTAAHRRGTEADAFQCTKRVLDYSMGNGAETVAVESVPQACDGARAVHEKYAEKYGYNLYRVFQNALHFGVPQNRERFWAIFSKRDTLSFDFAPRVVTVGQCYAPEIGGVQKRHDKYLSDQHALLKAAGLPASDVMGGKFGYGQLHKILGRVFEKYPAAAGDRKGYERVRPLLVNSAYRLCTQRLLDPNGYCGVVMGCSWFTHPDAGSPYGCRNLTEGEYALLMGYPAQYQMVPRSGHRSFLSKGVCPPVAEWLVRQLHSSTGTVLLWPKQTLDLTSGEIAVF